MAKAKSNLTTESVRTMLEQTQGKLVAARAELPAAQRRLALSWLGVRSVNNTTENVRTRIVQLEDAVAGLQALLPAAEYQQLTAKIAESEGERAELQPRIDAISRRHADLVAQTKDLPEPQATFLAGGSPPAHPKILQRSEALKELSALQNRRDLLDVEIRDCKRRRAEIESAHAEAIAEIVGPA